jgi:hypothetical protein
MLATDTHERTIVSKKWTNLPLRSNLEKGYLAMLEHFSKEAEGRGLAFL